MKSKSRSKMGSGLTEVILTALLLIPIALCLLDLMTLVIANQMNDTASKNAARAAANQPNGGQAFQAAQNSLSTFSSSPLVKSIGIEVFDYPGDKSAVTCQTKMVVKIPIPFFGVNEITFMAKDVEPILVR